jgi:hypothetical protein
MPVAAARAALLALALAALLLAQPAAAQAPALPADTAALQAFRSGISNANDTVLVTWDDALDPCGGTWVGVGCDCSQVPPSPTPCNNTDASGNARVLGLNLGPVYQAATQKLQGSIAPAVGNLSALRYLDLSDNRLK